MKKYLLTIFVCASLASCASGVDVDIGDIVVGDEGKIYNEQEVSGVYQLQEENCDLGFKEYLAISKEGEKLILKRSDAEPQSLPTFEGEYDLEGTIDENGVMEITDDDFTCTGTVTKSNHQLAANCDVDQKSPCQLRYDRIK